jgi:hypothetical protein
VEREALMGSADTLNWLSISIVALRLENFMMDGRNKVQHGIFGELP